MSRSLMPRSSLARNNPAKDYTYMVTSRRPFKLAWSWPNHWTIALIRFSVDGAFFITGRFLCLLSVSTRFWHNAESKGFCCRGRIPWTHFSAAKAKDTAQVASFPKRNDKYKDKCTIVAGKLHDNPLNDWNSKKETTSFKYLRTVDSALDLKQSSINLRCETKAIVGQTRDRAKTYKKEYEKESND